MKLLSTVVSAAIGAPCPVRLTELGRKVAECWYRMERLDDNVRIDKVIFMPTIYDTVLRSQEYYNRAWQYIDDNPAKWREDKLYME